MKNNTEILNLPKHEIEDDGFSGIKKKKNLYRTEHYETMKMYIKRKKEKRSFSYNN